MKPLKVPTPTTAAPSTEAARIQRLRDWIAAAVRDGADTSSLVLKLTHRDSAALKRHPSVQAGEIAFASGVMTFLGVRVIEGGVADSQLETAQ